MIFFDLRIHGIGVFINIIVVSAVFVSGVYCCSDITEALSSDDWNLVVDWWSCSREPPFSTANLMLTRHNLMFSNSTCQGALGRQLSQRTVTGSQAAFSGLLSWHWKSFVVITHRLRAHPAGKPPVGDWEYRRETSGWMVENDGISDPSPQAAKDVNSHSLFPKYNRANDIAHQHAHPAGT